MAGLSDEVQQWLDLADTVYRLVRDDRSYASRGSTVVSRAQDTLNAYEHTLSSLTRMQAREACCGGAIVLRHLCPWVALGGRSVNVAAVNWPAWLSVVRQSIRSN